MSRSPVLGLLGCLAMITLAGCGLPAPQSAPTPPTAGPEASPNQTAATPIPTPAGPTPAACEAVVSALPLEDQVGQLFMVGKDTGTPVDQAYAAMLTETRTGQVILLGNSDAGVESVRRLTDRIRAVAPAPGGVAVFVAVDQEGGRIQRLQGPGFDTIPPATQQGELSLPELQASAARWGGQLKQAGVDVNLAPVADVVPVDRVRTNDPVGRLQRHYGDQAAAVAPRVAAVVVGLHEAGVATSLKHFPGLGHVTGNTDFATGVTDTSIHRDHDDISAFRSGMSAGSDMVMVSTATYERIDPANQATFSRVIVTDLLRVQLGFTGVIVSDDLGAAQQVADIAPGERAVRFLIAGGDVVINGDPALQPTMTGAVRARADADPQFAAEVRSKATRVVRLKARYGGAACGS